MIGLPLTKRRRAAPGSLTCASVAAFFKKRRFPRSPVTINDFERAKYAEPDERFFALWSECVGCDVAETKADYARTRRWRLSKTGPFRADRAA